MKLKNPKTNYRNEIKTSDRFTGRLSSTVEKPFLSMNSSVLNYKIKEDKEASSFKLTPDHGLHHFVVTSVSKFSGSSFPPRAW